MKKRLIIFGCSLSAEGHLKTWSSRTGEHFTNSGHNIEILNFAVPASSNVLQIKRFQEFVINNSITNNDIVMWQVTGSERGHKRISNRFEEKYPDELSKLLKHKRSFYAKSINYFDENPRTDLLCHHPSCVGIDIDEEEVLQELLFCFKVAKQFTDQVLTFVGWDEAIPDNHSKKFTKFLKDNNIDFIAESLVTHTKANNLKFLPDGTHPAEEAYVSYADNMIVPVIKNLGWL